MAPRRLGGGGARGDEGILRVAYRELTSPDNQSVLRGVAVFGVAVAFFASSWSDYLLPP